MRVCYCLYYCSLYYTSQILSICSASLRPLKSGCPVCISTRMQPRLHMSGKITTKKSQCPSVLLCKATIELWILKICTNSMRVTARSAQQHFWRPWYKFLKVSNVVYLLHKATIELTFFPFRISTDRSGIAHRRRAACANCKKISKSKSPGTFTI